jgi:hypothetical protein
MTTTDRPATWRPDLHLRLARRYTLDVRATRAAAAALSVSLVAWAIGVDFTLHGALMALAAVVGAAVPARPPLTRAFGWIGREAGLAYQTHVEHDGRADPYGLLAAAAVQARLTIRGVTSPPRSPWWLPLAATAVAVWLIAAVVGPLGGLAGLGGAGTASPPPQASPPPVTAPQTDMDGEDGLQSDEDLTEEPEAGSQPFDPGRDAGDGADTSTGEASEGEAVERFLENLRERPAALGERSTDLAERDLDRDALREDEREEEQPRGARRDEDAALEGSLRPTDERDEDAASIDADVPGGGEREEGDDAEDGETEGAADGEGEEEPGLEQGDDGVREGDDGDTGEGMEQRQEGVPGDDDEMGFDAGEGQDAGIGSGAPDETPATELGPEGAPEALPGMLLPGEETPGGRVRLPGRDDGHVPEGRSVERYERAVEQAVTDGTVPVPYQEIIRNYFR